MGRGNVNVYKYHLRSWDKFFFVGEQKIKIIMEKSIKLW